MYNDKESMIIHIVKIQVGRKNQFSVKSIIKLVKNSYL